MSRRAVLALLLSPLSPSLASACAVCFGADGSNKELGTAFNIAVTITLGITMGLLATGIVWFSRLEGRRKAQDALLIARLDREAAGKELPGWSASSPTPAA